jgi:hypothetical protein
MSAGDSINQRKNGVNDGVYETSEGPNFLSHVKSSGGMTISPELFEKVCLQREEIVHPQPQSTHTKKRI